MNSESQQLKSIDDILTEKELLELLGVKKSVLDGFRRNHKLPFCKISHTNRVYLVRDVLGFIESKRMVIDRIA